MPVQLIRIFGQLGGWRCLRGTHFMRREQCVRAEAAFSKLTALHA